LDSGRALIFPAQNLPVFFTAQNVVRDVPCLRIAKPRPPFRTTGCFNHPVCRWNRRLGIALTGVRRARKGPIAMPKENDLEGVQDQGGKHGGQKGMPKPEPKPPTNSEPKPGDAPDQGIVRDERGQEQPRDRARAQQVSRTDTVRR
jgi:hypothetical protein